MDREDALRLVVFEYLLPMQRRARLECLRGCMERECMAKDGPDPSIGGLMNRLLMLSDTLLQTQGFATSFVMPLSMKDVDRVNVSALVDSPGPYRWFLNPQRTRRADPTWGLRTFKSGDFMPAGRIHMFD